MTLNDILNITDARIIHLSARLGRSLVSRIEVDSRNEPQLEDIEAIYGAYRVTRVGSCGNALELDVERA